MPPTWVTLGRTGQYQQFIGNNADQWGISNKFEAGLGAGLTLTSITASRHTDARGGEEGSLAPFAVFQQDTEYHHKQFTQELRLSGQVGTLADFTVGAFYYNASALNPGHIDIQGGLVYGSGAGAIPGGPNLYLADFLTDDPIESRSKSGFAHTVFHLTSDLNLTAGVRYTSESKEYTFHRYGVGAQRSTIVSARNCSSMPRSQRGSKGVASTRGHTSPRKRCPITPRR